MSRRWSLIAVVVSAACFGTLGVLTKCAYAAGADQPITLLAWRFMFASLLLGALVGIIQPRALRVPRSDLARFAALALAGYGAASICFFFALQFASVSVVAVLLYAYPALVTVASWLFLGEKATWQRGSAVLITFAGCALVVGLFGGPAQVEPAGVLLGLGAAVGYTLFNLLSDRWLPGRSQLVMMCYTFGIAAIGMVLVALVTGLLRSSGSSASMVERTVAVVATLSPASWQPSAWAYLAAIVLVPTFAAVVLYLEGIRGLGPSQAAVVSTLEPLFTIALARAVLGDQLAVAQWVGAALVLGGVLFAEITARRVERPAAF